MRALLSWWWTPAWLLKRWWSYDRDILWPSLLEAANGDRARARAAYRLHMEVDPAYWGLDVPTREKIIGTLDWA